MADEVLSFVPGPAHVREEVRAAMATPPLPHRSAAFREVVVRVHEGLAALLETASPILPVLASGTGTLETALRGVARKRVLCLSGGAFGDRIAKIAGAIGLEAEWSLPRDLRLRGGLLYLPGLTDIDRDWLFRSELELTVPIWDPIFARFRVRNINDNNPAPGVGSNEFTTNLGLSLQF